MSEELPITRDEAIELLRQYNDDSDMWHYIESGAIMKELAIHLGKNEEEQRYWEILGLLHDVDWGITKNDVKTHLTKAPDILREAGFDEKFIETVLSHGYGFPELPHLADKKRTEKIHHALASSETLTGLIHSYALMRPNNLEGMKPKGVKKKFKDRAFAAKVEREIIEEIKHLGVELSDFFKIGIEGVKKVAKEVGLDNKS